MGSIDIIKPLSTVLRSAVNNFHQHQEKKFLGTPRIIPGAAGCEARMLSIVLCGPLKLFYLVWKGVRGHFGNLQ